MPIGSKDKVNVDQKTDFIAIDSGSHEPSESKFSGEVNSQAILIKSYTDQEFEKIKAKTKSHELLKIVKEGLIEHGVIFEAGEETGVDFPHGLLKTVSTYIINLTLTQGDVDYFRVEYKPSKWDTEHKMEFEHRVIRNDSSGRVDEIYFPAQLKLEIEEEFDQNISLDLYHLNNKRTPKYHNVGSNVKFSLDNPFFEFGDKLYMILTNPDFDSQGPLRYIVKATYRSAGRLVIGVLFIGPNPQMEELRKRIESERPRPGDPEWEKLFAETGINLDDCKVSYHEYTDYKPQYYPGSTSVGINRRKHMSDNLEKLRDIPEADVVAIMGHRAPGADYSSTHPPLKEMGEPDCPVRQIVAPTAGAAAGDRIRYSQWTDSIYFAPSTPYWRSYWGAINCKGCDPGTLSGRQIIESRERDIEAYTKKQYDSEMTDVALCSMRGCTVHGHSLRLEENGMQFDMLARTEMGKDGNVYAVKDQVGIPLDKKINLGKPMSETEAKKRTTIFRVDGIPMCGKVGARKYDEAVEALHHMWELRSKWGFRPE